MTSNFRLTAISPIDGRYRDKVDELENYFSEHALIRYRVYVEVEYFIALCELPLPALANFDHDKTEQLRDVYRNFSIDYSQRVKEIEKTTNHDVKAVEYFLREQFDKLGIKPEFKEFIHFGLTSQDINNTAVPASLRDAVNKTYAPVLEEIIKQLSDMAEEWKDIPMLARTHGQPASPTRLGKEINVFAERLKVQYAQLHQIPYSAKFGGATGNFNAHKVAFPEIDWLKFANNFVNNTLQLHRSQPTTQIEHYDNLAALFDNMARINTILIDLSRDIWQYISMEYFRQRIKAGEVGSSAMPHKVNPIDFENAEGNFGIANAVFHHLSAKLPISRLQRDLTDSTVLRNVGVPVAHTIIAFRSLQKGIGKLLLNRTAIEADLEENWAVVAEAIQTVLRSVGYPNPYEALKQLTRTNEKITSKTIAVFIDELDVDDSIKARLRVITPQTYTGL
jgi:adenylosuccinate lyase